MSPLSVVVGTAVRARSAMCAMGSFLPACQLQQLEQLIKLAFPLGQRRPRIEPIVRESRKQVHVEVKDGLLSRRAAGMEEVDAVRPEQTPVVLAKHPDGAHDTPTDSLRHVKHIGVVSHGRDQRMALRVGNAREEGDDLIIAIDDPGRR